MPGRRYTAEEKARAVEIAIPLLAQGISTRALETQTGIGSYTLFRALQHYPAALQARLPGIDHRCNLMPGTPQRVIEARRLRARLRLTLYRELNGLPPIPVGRRRRADPLRLALATLRRLAAQGYAASVAPEQQPE